MRRSKRPTSAAINGNQQSPKLAQFFRRVHGFLLLSLVAVAGVFLNLSLTEQRLSLDAQHEGAALANLTADQVAQNQGYHSDKGGPFIAGYEVADRASNRGSNQRVRNASAEHNSVRDFFQPLGVQVNDLRVVSHESSQSGNLDTAPLALAALAGATRRKSAKKKSARKRSTRPRAPAATPPATPPDNPNENPGAVPAAAVEQPSAEAEALRGRTR